MKPDGSIEWTPPAGNWIVLRIGYSLTGHKNSPASPEATGLEVDKLNAGHVKAYFTNYLDQYKDATGGLMVVLRGVLRWQHVIKPMFVNRHLLLIYTDKIWWLQNR